MLKLKKKRPVRARMSLLDYEFLMEMAKIMDFGTVKYAEEDWRTNENVKVKARLDSLARHLAKYSVDAEPDLDSDHGISHLAAIAINAMICWWIAKYKPERDDRWTSR